jgi:hypothetical protein
MVLPRAESAMSVSRRRARVSSRFALTTHQIAALRYEGLESSIRLRTPSIQPKQSASSTASGQLMLGRPESFLWKPTQSSGASSWWPSNQSRSSAGVRKTVAFRVAGG